MPLLDGKYEVMSQRPLDAVRTLFEATAPDGTPLRIEWFDLPQEQDAAFERYRRLLRRLKREGLAAVHDVISRPGARYVAWYRADNAAATHPDEQLAALLASFGFDGSAADLRKPPGRGAARLYGLGFDGQSAPPPELQLPEEVRPLRGGTARTRSPAFPFLEDLSQRTLSWAVTGLFLVAAAALLLVAFQRRVVDGSVVLPDLVGRPVQEVVATLTDLRLEVRITAAASQDAPGTVLTQEPHAGSELRPGRVVRLSYALPPGQLEPTDVPSLVGLVHPTGVEAALAAAGLSLGEVARIDAAAPAGLVLAQSLAAGARVGSGSPVSVLVSAGPRKVQTFVPNLVGLRLEEARELALIAGIAPERIVVDEISAASGSSGTVLAQSLAPNVAVPRDEAILRLVVQAGSPTPLTVGGGAPDLVGMTRSQAEAVAAAGRWSVSITPVATLNLPADIIVAQDPPPGTEAAGGALSLVVNVHPRPITLPDFRAVVREPEPRAFAYAWTILPGIPTMQAQVWATTLDGRRLLVETAEVTGGEILRGSFLTADSGPISFELLLEGLPYGDTLLVP